MSLKERVVFVVRLPRYVAFESVHMVIWSLQGEKEEIPRIFRDAGMYLSNLHYQ